MSLRWGRAESCTTFPIKCTTTEPGRKARRSSSLRWARRRGTKWPEKTAKPALLRPRVRRSPHAEAALEGNTRDIVANADCPVMSGALELRFRRRQPLRHLHVKLIDPQQARSESGKQGGDRG